MPAHYVILGDVVRSRTLRDPTFRWRLEDLCETLTRLSGDHTVAPFRILKGMDELGAVLASLLPLVPLLRETVYRIHPRVIRWVVVYGEIRVGLETRDIARMDGEAFHRAALHMDTLKRQDLRFYLEGHDPLLDPAVSSALNALLLLKERWTPEQVEVARIYERERNQTRVAQHLGITQQAVSDRLRRARWHQVFILEQQLQQVLEAYHARFSSSGPLR